MKYQLVEFSTTGGSIETYDQPNTRIVYYREFKSEDDSYRYGMLLVKNLNKEGK